MAIIIVDIFFCVVMEGSVAKALKPSLRGELISQQQLALGEEILCFNANNGVVGEDFSVDDLLDFSEFQHGSVGKGIDVFEEEEEEDEEKDSTSGSSQDRTEDDSNSNSTGAIDSDSIFAGELAVPVSP